MPEFKPVKRSLKAAALDAVRSKDFDTAIKKYNEYLALEPNQMDDDAWAGLGGAYRRKEELELSLRSYEKAYQINPQSTYALGNIISLLAASRLPADREKLEKQYLPEAVRLTQQKASAPDSDHWAWYDLAMAQLIEGLFDQSKSGEAVNTFYFAAERTPPSAKENFRSVLSNLAFLAEHNPGIPKINEVIEMIKRRAE
jgi:tetratricopeptide (TPR) repeat protein